MSLALIRFQLWIRLFQLPGYVPAAFFQRANDPSGVLIRHFKHFFQPFLGSLEDHQNADFSGHFTMDVLCHVLRGVCVQHMLRQITIALGELCVGIVIENKIVLGAIFIGRRLTNVIRACVMSHKRARKQ